MSHMCTNTNKTSHVTVIGKRLVENISKTEELCLA